MFITLIVVFLVDIITVFTTNAFQRDLSGIGHFPIYTIRELIFHDLNALIFILILHEPFQASNACFWVKTIYHYTIQNRDFGRFTIRSD